MHDEIEKKVYVVEPLKKICMTIGELPSSYLETMTYYEMLIWFTNYLRDTIIPTVNNNAEAVEELQLLFIKLQQYVNDFFTYDNLKDVINEIITDAIQSGLLYLALDYIPEEERLNIIITEEGEN